MSKPALLPLLVAFTLGGCVASEGDPLPTDDTPTPRGGAQTSEVALSLLRASLKASFEDVLDPLDPKQQAELTNALAWADEHPLQLRVTHGRRGTVTHVSARYLGFDASPKLDSEPSTDRAKDLFEPDGFGRALLSLGPDEQLELLADIDLEDGSHRFDFRRRWQDVEVHDGAVSVVLDKAGRLTAVDAGAAAHIDPQNELQLDEQDAIAVAVDDLKQRHDPLWEGIDIEVVQADKMLANVEPWTDNDEDHFVWRVELRGEDGGGGDREVFVDGDGDVLASVEHTKFMLGPQDRIERWTGFVGETISQVIDPAYPWTGDQWNSIDDPCAGIVDPVSGMSALERDRDETKAALCEAALLVESASSHSFRAWFDPSNTGIVAGVGLQPLLSVAQNTGGRIVFAEGVARAEVVGHELFHTVMGPRGLASITTGTEAEAGAVEEHMADAFGMLLERRFTARTEDDCLLDDDADSMATIAGQDLDPASSAHAYRPCADVGTVAPWRSACAPRNDNGGWCEGAQTYQDLAYNIYDAYGDPEGPTRHVASHTNLGVGNRVFMAMLGEASAGFDGSRFTAQSDAAMLDMLLRAAIGLSGDVDWARWGEAWIGAARAVDASAMIGPAERHLTAQLHRAGVWTSHSAVQAATGGGAPTLVNPMQQIQPAAASTVLHTSGGEGIERTYVFYRPDTFGTEVRYVWRDDPRGGTVSAPTGDWTGPCTLPVVATKHDVAATGRSMGGLFVAWNDAAAAGGTGTLRVQSLLPGSEAAPGTCGDTWLEVMPAEARQMQGAPALANWTATSDRTICEILGAEFPGLELPFRTIGAMGLNIGDCVDIGEILPPFVPSPLPSWLGPYMLDLLNPPFEEAPSIGIPAPFAPVNPGLPYGSVERHLPLGPLLAKDPEAQGGLAKAGELGPRFAAAFAEVGLPDAHGVDFIARWNIGAGGDPKTGLPLGEIETVEWRFVDERLIVAFRDAGGAVRVAPFTDPRPIAELPILETDPVADPALATASRRARDPDTGLGFELEHLYVVYGTTEDDGEGPVANRLNYRVATFLDDPTDPAAFKIDIFSPQHRLDTIQDVRGTRRHVNYANLRTRRTPVVAGQEGLLHVFVVGQSNFWETFEPPAADILEESARSSRIRHAQLTVLPDGTLTWSSERPTLLQHTRGLGSGAPGRAGTALVTHHREKLRWFYPDGAQLQSRSRY